MTVLEEQISDTVGFKLCTKEEGIAVFSQAIELDPVRDKQLSLLAVGNLTGKIALSNVTSIKIGKTSQFHPKEQEEDVDESDIGSLKVVHGSGKIREVKFNATEKRLWVLEDDKLAYISFKNDLEETKLELEYTRFTEISSILPHPIISGHLAFVTNDNVLHVLPNFEEGNSIEVLQDVRCFAWAMDGKSLVAMKNSNEIYVFDVDGEKKNALSVDTSVASELDLNIDTLVPCSIQSLSNDKWLVVYDGEDASPDDHHIASFVVTTNGEPETTTTTTTTIAAEILLPGFDSQRCTSYYSQSLPNWSQNYPSLALATSSLATEIVVLNMGIKTSFITPDEDLYRTIFPMNDTTEEDTNALGFAVDLTGTHLKVIQPWAGLDEAVGVLPIAWVLLDTGRLSGWYLVDKQGIQNSQLSLLETLRTHEKEVISGDLESENSDVELGRKNSNPFASSASEANPFAPSKTSPFGTITTKGNPFASGFGKTSASDSLKDASASSAMSTSGFGQSGFGSSGFNNAGTTSAFGSSGFGSTSFGASSASSAFGKTSFGNLNTASKSNANSSTTTTTFGQPGLVGSSFGQTSFESTGNQNPSGFKSSTTTHSGFAKFSNSSVTPSSDSPFAALNGSSTDSTKKDSPFGSLGDSEKKSSPFGGLGGSTKKDSPFGSLGDSEKKSSPFGSLGDSAKKDSPFGSLGDSAKKDSPFGSLGDSEKKSSLFGSLGDSAKKDSPFGSLGDSEKKSSLFGSLGDSEKKPSPFDTMKKDLIIETSEVSTKESSPVDEPGSTISTNTPSNNQNANSNGPTPYAVPIDTASEVGVESGNESSIGIEVVPTSSSTNFFKKEADSLEDGHNNKSMGSLGNPKGFITKNQFTMRNSSQNLSSFSVSSVKSGDFENTHPNIQIELLAGASDKKEGYIESLDESEISAEEPPEETESSSVTDSVQEPFEVLGEPTLDVEEDSDGSIEETSEFEKIRFSGPRPPVSYSRYDGPTKELPRSNNEIYDMMVQIYNHTEGQLKVLHMNTRSFEKFVKSNEQKDYSDNFSKDLASWRLAWCEMFQEILVDFSTEVYDLETILKAQLTKSEKVKKNANELRKGVEEIQKMLAFIAKFQAEKNEEVLKKMELDLGSQKLQRSLRTKLSNVEQQYEKLIALMMPLKTRFSDPQNMIFNINKAILRLKSNVVKCEGRFLNLERLNSSTSKATQKLVDYTPLTQESKADDSRLSQWDYGLVEISQKSALFE